MRVPFSVPSESLGCSSRLLALTPFILTGVKNANEFRDLVLRQRDSLVTGSAQQSTPTTESSDVLIEIRDILTKIESKLSEE